MQEKTIPQIFEEIKEQTCDLFCKMPDMYLAMYKDPNEAHEMMLKEQCKRCPLGRLG